MSPPPTRPKLYHITHVDNLSAIVADGLLLSDAAMIGRGGPPKTIGMSAIKQRRVEVLQVTTHPGTKVGDYVPFYFCPRSVMLFVLHRANHPELQYNGGQGPIVRLEADLYRVIEWAEAHSRRWAFSLSNAGAYYTEFRSDPAQLAELDWDAIAASDFRNSGVQEHKQAEFLVYQSFPLELVERIGVQSAPVKGRAAAAFYKAAHKPLIEVCPQWYF